MICTIGGIDYTIRIMPDYAPAADLAIKWDMATNGKRIKTDRGATADVHRCSIRVMGDTTTVRGIYSALTAKGADRITKTTLEAGEYLFGPTTPIDAAPVETVWENIGELTQRTLTTSGFDATIALNAALVYDVAAPVLPFTVRPIASATILVDNQFSARPFYDVSTSGFDGIQATADSAEYRFSLVANRAEAGAMQTWYESVNRGAVLTNVAGAALVLKGVTAPFGNAFTWPCAFVVTEMYFAPMGPEYWRVTWTIARAK